MTKVVSMIVRRDGPSWSAWSPQCPGLAVAEPTADELRSALPDVLAWYFDGATDVDMQIHLEQELRGVVVRIAQDAAVWERQLVAERLGAALGTKDQAAELGAAVPNSAGEVIYVCGRPSDPISWLTAQMDDAADAVVVALPATDSTLWTFQFSTAMPQGEQSAGVGYRPDMTLAEVLESLTGPRLRLSA